MLRVVWITCGLFCGFVLFADGTKDLLAQTEEEVQVDSSDVSKEDRVVNLKNRIDYFYESGSESVKYKGTKLFRSGYFERSFYQSANNLRESESLFKKDQRRPS